MQFIVITRRRTESFSDAEFAEQLPGESDRARELYADGHFRTINSRGDIPGAVIVVEARDLEDASRLVGTLPLAKLDMMDVQIIPVRPYRGFVGG